LGLLTTAGASVLNGSTPASIFVIFMNAVRIELEVFQRDLAKIDKQLAKSQSDLKAIMESPMKVAFAQLDLASVTIDPGKREHALASAHDAFLSAVTLVSTTILPDEIAKHLPVVRARIYAGICMDLRAEPGAALKHYEAGYQRSLEIEGAIVYYSTGPHLTNLRGIVRC
jgi:hypothetical protein